jgi:hypothetical protein
MKKCFFAVLLLLLAIPVFGQDVGPNQVIIFEHNDFVGKSVSFTLESGMRQKLVPKLLNFNDKVSSILVGKNVKVWVYEHVDFKGKSTFRTASTKQLSKHKWVYIASNATVSDHEEINDKISSMIIFPQHRIRPVGVDLEGNDRLQFFPLAENKTEDKAEFPDLTDYMNDKAETLLLRGNVAVTVYEHNDFKGASLKFPGAGPSQDKSNYGLGTYQFKNKVSSLIVQGLGDEVWKMATLKGTTTPHRAPEKKESDMKPTMAPHEAKVITPQQAPEIQAVGTGSTMTPKTGTLVTSEPRFDLFKELEEDTDRPGHDYRNFDLPHPEPPLCLIECQNDPRCKAFTYVRPGFQGPKARCWLKGVAPPAKASSCCISGVKK